MNEEESMTDEETGTDQPEGPTEGGWAPGRHIHYAVMMLMQDVENIGKTGQVDAKAGGYRFRGIEQTVQEVGASARKHGLMLQSEVLRESYDTVQRDSRVWTSCRLVMRYVFTSLEDGSTLYFEAAGEGRDSADKATSKAMSMALKYALGQALLIGTGDDDPDSERPEIPAQERTQAAPQSSPPPQETPMQRATRALEAAQKASTRTGLEKIRVQAEQERLMDLVGPDGTTLASRLTVLHHTLPEGT